MRYYSTLHTSPDVTLQDAITQGVAADCGLFMPREIKRLPLAFIRNMGSMELRDIAYVVANTLLGEDIDSATLKKIVYDSLNFDMPLRRIEGNRYALEMFHGPTMSFKDIGARFMARLLSHYNSRSGRGLLNVLVATSGDSGSAVANGFLDLPNVHVTVLYPKGKLNRLQESQFTTLGHNVTAIEVIGSIDDCQKLVQATLADGELKRSLNITTANSINIACLLPQTIAYFQAWAELSRFGAHNDRIVVAVPCGNLGDLTAGIIAKRMGLPISRFIAAQNRNNPFVEYLETGKLTPKRTVPTIASSMDKGNPSNLPRVIDLYGGDHAAITRDISGVAYDDRQIAATLTDTWFRRDYLLDPHSATACRAINEGIRQGETGVVMATAHPAKFRERIDRITGQAMPIPPTLGAFIRGEMRKMQLSPTLGCFKKYLMTLQ